MTSARLDQTAGGSAAVATGTRPRIALAHDWLVGYRGGEAVLDRIARLCDGRYDIAGVFTMFDDGRGVTPAIDRQLKFVWGPGRRPPMTGAGRRWLLPLYPMAVKNLARQLAFDHARRPVDLVISTSSAAIKGITPPPGVPHICYCHSPARYLWSQQAEYSRGGLGWLRQLGLSCCGPALRHWDRRTAKTVTTFVANSRHIQREIERCYGRESVVVHPPVRTEFFTPPAEPRAREGWLCVGALEPYKRVDLAIAAAAAAGARLTVVGTGSQFDRLRSTAGKAVRFVGRVSDEEVREHFRTASMLIFPQIEDFGIVAVEAQACGLPVIAFRAGGALDSVIENQTGVFFDEATPESLAAAARKCLELGNVSAACRANAERFSEDRFEREMLAIIEDTLQ